MREVRELDQHSLIKEWRAGLAEDKAGAGAYRKATNLLAVSASSLFLWSDQLSLLLVANLKPSLQDFYQKLIPTEVPNFTVERVSVNNLSTLICLSGPQGICIVRLPRRSGAKGLYQGDKETVLCKSQNLDERLYITHCEVFQVSWHPGSTSDCHLLVLTSDNSIRLYDVSRTENHLITTWPCGPRVPRATLLPSHILGDTIVSFVVAPPRAPFKRNVFRDDPDPDKYAIRWPALILKGNGDVYMMDVTIDPKRSSPPDIIGPLKMYPPADDNYGVESCSIMMLGNSLISIATCGGTLYHCILLPNEEDDEKPSVQHKFPSDHSLYVIEAIELDLGLCLNDSDPGYTCPIFLIPDEGVKNRYFCYHEAGVHMITAPAVNQMETFFNGNDDDIEDLLPSFNQPSVVEYVICTKTSQMNEINPPVCVSVMYSPHSLITLLSDGRAVTKTLEKDGLEEMLFNDTLDTVRDMNTNANRSELSASLKELHKIPFDVQIKLILKHELNQPILKLALENTSKNQNQNANNADNAKSEMFRKMSMLLTHATHIFQEEFFTKLERARKELEKRVKTLKLLKKHQTEEINEWKTNSALAIDEGKRLRDKCNETVKAQQLLNKRCEKVLLALSQQQSAPSAAEQEMSGDLKQMNAKLDNFKKEMEKIHKKQKYQTIQITNWEANRKNKEVILGKNHNNIIKATIEKQTSQIKEIIQMINSLKSKLNLI